MGGHRANISPPYGGTESETLDVSICQQSTIGVKGNLQIIIENVTKDDAGKYFCTTSSTLGKFSFVIYCNFSTYDQMN